MIDWLIDKEIDVGIVGNTIEEQNYTSEMKLAMHPSSVDETQKKDYM